MVHLAASNQKPLKWSLQGRASKSIPSFCKQSLWLQMEGQSRPVGNGPVGNLFGDTYTNGKISPPITASLNLDARIPLGIRHRAKLWLLTGKGSAWPIDHCKHFSPEFRKPRDRVDPGSLESSLGYSLYHISVQFHGADRHHVGYNISSLVLRAPHVPSTGQKAVPAVSCPSLQRF